LAQLVGNLRADGVNGNQLLVVFATHGTKRYTIMREEFSAREDRLNCEQDSRFTLCSLDDDVDAVMLNLTNRTL